MSRNMKLLIVDDSVVFRSQIKSALVGIEGIEVIGVANNGKIALNAMQKEKVDIVTLDLEMPEMDGLETLRQIKILNLKPKVIVFSSNTARGANQTISALELGAVDVVTKPGGTISSLEAAKDHIKQELVPKILQFAGIKHDLGIKKPKTVPSIRPIAQQKLSSEKYIKKNINFLKPHIILVGSSTGGPLALETLFSKLPKTISVPILVAQHMPPIFTNSLAKRLQQLTGIEVAEGKSGDLIQKNRILIAPGDYHMKVKSSPQGNIIHLDQSEKRNSVRPAVDHLFESVSEIYKENILSFILTGMGSDGADGCEAIMRNHGNVIIQDEESSVVWGMPGSVFSRDSFDKMLSLEQCSQTLSNLLYRMK